MRVISGTARGHRLKMPGGGQTRPAMDRVKASLFSILGPRLPGCHFLDLFAGCGSLGIEALSRGAALAVFVDTSRECIRVIGENLAHTKLAAGGRCFKMDCLQFLRQQPVAVARFDLVCIDPPYSKGLLAPILDQLPACRWFDADTRFVIERQRRDELQLAERTALELLDERCYGETVLTFFRLRQAEPARDAIEPAST